MNTLRLQDELPELPQLDKGKYRHYKGKEYEVIGVGLDTETLAPSVIYRQLNAGAGPEYWMRPFAMFTGHALLDGERIQRFEKIED